MNKQTYWIEQVTNGWEVSVNHASKHVFSTWQEVVNFLAKGTGMTVKKVTPNQRAELENIVRQARDSMIDLLQWIVRNL